MWRNIGAVLAGYGGFVVGLVFVPGSMCDEGPFAATWAFFLAGLAVRLLARRWGWLWSMAIYVPGEWLRAVMVSTGCRAFWNWPYSPRTMLLIAAVYHLIVITGGGLLGAKITRRWREPAAPDNN